MFADALKSAEMGGRLDPTRSSEASALTEKLLEQWRHHENQRMTQALDHEKFDQASSAILEIG